MSSKVVSPTAQLLRSSRLFSLPPPLPRPVLDYRTSSGTDGASRTATLPYPIQQAIETPTSSLSRGDWGLKRPLPLRSTAKASNPTLRINAIDTIEHITDFEPASNHVATVQKWQSMNVPMTTYAKVERSSYAKSTRVHSVYEDKFDNTYPGQKDDSGMRNERWRFGGRWVAGMDPSEFETYVLKQLKNQRAAFKQFVRRKERQNRLQEARAVARDKGESQESVEEIQISHEDLKGAIMALRSNFALGQDLAKYIQEFLDLPALPKLDIYDSFAGPTSKSTSRRASEVAFDDVFKTASRGPPRTHPGAGLSYIRTGSFLQNHPVLGPRAHREPVQARVLTPVAKSGTSKKLVLGIGGIAAEDASGSLQPWAKVGSPLADSHKSKNSSRGIEKHDFESPGGTKVWVEPERASINVNGKIELVFANANKDNVGMHIGENSRHYTLSPKATPLVPEGSTISLPTALDDPIYKNSSREGGQSSEETIRNIEAMLVSKNKV